MRVNTTGITSERIKEIAEDPSQVSFPKPGIEGVFPWASRLSDEQLLAATIIYTDLWTWDEGNPFHKLVLQALEEEAELRGGVEPSTGDVLYSGIDKRMYYYNGHTWIPFQEVNVEVKTYGTATLEYCDEDG